MKKKKNSQEYEVDWSKEEKVNKDIKMNWIVKLGKGVRRKSYMKEKNK